MPRTRCWVVGKVMNECCIRWSWMHPRGECIILPTSRCIQTFIHRLEILMLHLLIELERNPPRNFWTIHDSDFSFLEWWVLRRRDWVQVDIFRRPSGKSCFAPNEPNCLIWIQRSSCSPKFKWKEKRICSHLWAVSFLVSNYLSCFRGALLWKIR